MEATEPLPDDRPALPGTRAIATGLLERLQLLLQVTIMPEHGAQPCVRSRSLLIAKQGMYAKGEVARVKRREKRLV